MYVIPFALSLSKPVLSQPKGVNGKQCNYRVSIRSWFDRPALSEVEGLTTNDLNQRFPGWKNPPLISKMH